MNGNRADLTVCPYTHVRPPDTCAGSNDVVHIVFLQIAAWIFPEKMDGGKAGENLSVMGVAAEVQICSCFGNFFQFSGLMIHKYNRFAPVQVLSKLGGSFSLLVELF